MSDTIVLNPQRVEEIFLDCLFQDGEDTSGAMMAEGIIADYGFSPERLESHCDEIMAMLEELPDDFRESGGGGMSFLNACMDRHGNQWTGMHQTMEQLMVLGIALKLVSYMLPKSLWPSLHGGMPYFTILI